MVGLHRNLYCIGEYIINIHTQYGFYWRSDFKDIKRLQHLGEISPKSLKSFLWTQRFFEEHLNVGPSSIKSWRSKGALGLKREMMIEMVVKNRKKAMMSIDNAHTIERINLK